MPLTCHDHTLFLFRNLKRWVRMTTHTLETLTLWLITSLSLIKRTFLTCPKRPFSFLSFLLCISSLSYPFLHFLFFQTSKDSIKTTSLQLCNTSHLQQLQLFTYRKRQGLLWFLQKLKPKGVIGEELVKQVILIPSRFLFLFLSMRETSNIQKKKGGKFWNETLAATPPRANAET